MTTTTVNREIEQCVEQLIKLAFEPKQQELLALAERISNIRQHLSGHEQMFVECNFHTIGEAV
jgi:hypothetical protein